MQHPVLLGRDSWVRFSERYYRTLFPRPSENGVLGDLSLSHRKPMGTVAFISDCSAPTGAYPLFYAGGIGFLLSLDHEFIHAAPVLSSSAPALAGSYLVGILHSATHLSVDEHPVEHGISRSRVGWHNGVGTR